jgi:hypothetical protein
VQAPQLRVLDASRTAITVKALQFAASACMRLHSLNILGCNQLDDTAITTLTCMQQLTNLQLSSPKLTQTSLSLLTSLSHVGVLNLSNPAITAGITPSVAIQPSSMGTSVQRSLPQDRDSRQLLAHSAQELGCLNSMTLPLGAPLRTGFSLPLVHSKASKRMSNDAGSLANAMESCVQWHSRTPALRLRGQLGSSMESSSRHVPKPDA